MEGKILLLIVALAVALSQAKTIRSKIYTNENGTKDLVFSNDSDVRQEDIDLLINVLKTINITTDNIVVDAPESRETLNEEPVSENILKKHWNALTEVGWKTFQNRVDENSYSNDTRKALTDSTNGTRGDGEEKNGEDVSEEGRKPRTEFPETTHLCRAINEVCHAVQPRKNQKKLITCLTKKNRTLLYRIEDKLNDQMLLACLSAKGANGTSEPETEADEGKSTTGISRTFVRPRRLLHKILLPLLVLIVIKYLVTLPFVAVSVFTLNAMWLGLLSLGAVMVSKMKAPERVYAKYPLRRAPPEIYDAGRDVLPASEFFWNPLRYPVARSAFGAR